jgi:5'(3')-deoxyribonucleotidase
VTSRQDSGIFWSSEESRLRIALDLDGVVYRWDDTAFFLIEEYFGVKIGPSTYWNYIKDELIRRGLAADPDHPLPDGQVDVWKWLWNEGVTKYGLFRYGSLYKGAREALRRIEDMGHDIVVITTRPKAAIRDTMDWLAFQGIAAAEVHILPFGVPKSGIPCHVYLDDGPHNVEDILKNQHNAAMVLWDRSWNQEITDPRVERVHSWREFEEFLRAVSGT